MSIIVCGTVALFLGLPVFAIIERALGEGDFFEAVTSSGVTEALRLSVVTTAVSLVLILAFGTPTAYIWRAAVFQDAICWTP
jgi:ABC-type sulfate transport system permease component